MSVRDADSERSFRTFASLFAVATICYHAQLKVPIDFDAGTAELVAACAVLARPAFLPAFLALVGLQAAAVFGELPAANTNRILQLFVDVAVLLAALEVVLRRRGANTGSLVLDVFRACRWPLALELVLVYGWTFIDKLNSGFFDPAGSCALQIVEKLPFVAGAPQSLLIPLIPATLGVEGALGPLLLVRRTRHWGVRIGLAFHVMLGLAGYYSFSATMIALLWLFVPASGLDDIRRQLGRWREHRTALLVAAVLVFSVILMLALHDDPDLWPLVTRWAGAGPVSQHLGLLALNIGSRIVFGLWIPLMAALLVLVWTSRWRTDSLEASSLSASNRVVGFALVGPLLVLANGAAPYLGWKTESAFAMYSNLRTEPGFENHLFLPTIPVAGYQSDLVTILASSDPSLGDLAARAEPIPLVELRRRIAAATAAGTRDIHVAYARGGARREVTDAGSDAELSTPLTFAERKLLGFRPIRTGSCEH